jgi:predicted nucleic acid-binding protein
MFLLDTVVLSELRKKDRNPGLIAWMRDKHASDLFISVVSIGEIAKGIAGQTVKNSEFAKRLQLWLDRLLLVYQDRMLAVDVAVAKRWGILAHQAGNSGVDILLAATAIEHHLTVVTRNERHFIPAGTATVNPWT